MFALAQRMTGLGRRHDAIVLIDELRMSGVGQAPRAGDEISMALRIDGDRVADVRFNGKGCAISQASASILTEEIKGKTLDEVKAIDRDHILENLGIPISPARIKCALLSLKTLKGAAWGLPAWPGEDEAKARSAG